MVGELGKAEPFASWAKGKRGIDWSPLLLQRHNPHFPWAFTTPHLLKVPPLSPASCWETSSNMRTWGNIKIQTVVSCLEWMSTLSPFKFCNCYKNRVAEIECWKHCYRMLVSEGTVDLLGNPFQNESSVMSKLLQWKGLWKCFVSGLSSKEQIHAL